MQILSSLGAVLIVVVFVAILLLCATLLMMLKQRWRIWRKEKKAVQVAWVALA